MHRLRTLKVYFFILPSLIGFSILYLIPFIWGIRYSVSLSGFDNTFVGLVNYKNVLLSGAFRLALKYTGVFMAIAIPLIMILSFLLALAIYELKPSKWLYLFIVLPIAVPSATVAGFFRKLIGTGAFSLLNSDFAMLGVILIFIWKNTGYNLIIYLAGLMQLDSAVIEASKIDGAGYLKRLWHIVIPMCTPVTTLAGIVTVINSFRVLKDVYILQGSYPNPQIYMLQHFMNNKFKDLQYEKLTSAAYLFAAIIFFGAFILFQMDRSCSRVKGIVLYTNTPGVILSKEDTLAEIAELGGSKQLLFSAGAAGIEYDFIKSAGEIEVKPDSSNSSGRVKITSLSRIIENGKIAVNGEFISGDIEDFIIGQELKAIISRRYTRRGFYTVPKASVIAFEGFDEGKNGVVYLLDEKDGILGKEYEAKKAEVKILAVGDEDVIVSGLEDYENPKVVTNPSYKINDGTKVFLWE